MKESSRVALLAVSRASSAARDATMAAHNNGGVGPSPAAQARPRIIGGDGRRLGNDADCDAGPPRVPATIGNLSGALQRAPSSGFPTCPTTRPLYWARPASTSRASARATSRSRGRGDTLRGLRRLPVVTQRHREQ